MSVDSFIAIKSIAFYLKQKKVHLKVYCFLGIYFSLNKVSATIDQRISNKTHPSMEGNYVHRIAEGGKNEIDPSI